MKNNNGGESHTMAEEAEETRKMTPEINPNMKKLIRLRDALWDIAKTMGAGAAYTAVLILTVKYFYGMVEAEKMALDYAMVMAVACTAFFHAFVGLCYMTTK